MQVQFSSVAQSCLTLCNPMNHSTMGTITDRNGMDLTEAEQIKKTWQKYIEKLIKRDLNDPDNHSGVIIHLEPDIVKCKVRWALGKHHYE